MTKSFKELDENDLMHFNQKNMSPQGNLNSVQNGVIKIQFVCFGFSDLWDEGISL